MGAPTSCPVSSANCVRNLEARVAGTVMLKLKGQQELLNMTMAPSGASCVAAHDGLWMMGPARSVKVQKKRAAS